MKESKFTSEMLIFALFLALCCISQVTSSAEVFRSYLAQHKISIEDHEFDRKLSVFNGNLRYIDEFNKKDDAGVKLGVTPFTHLTHAEFQEYVMRGVPKTPRPDRSLGSVHVFTEESIPDDIDWSTTGAVTPVKDQGTCGSCWTFAATGALEGAYYVAKQSVSYAGTNSANGFKGFSEQQLNACNPYSDGCDGGWAESAFIWAAINNGVATEAAYPYEAYNWQEGVSYTCNSNVANYPSSTTIPENPFSWVTPNNVNALKSAVARQPVAVAIDASSNVFQNYNSGVITSSHCGSDVNHAVLVVGYGTLNGVDYWKVKNSWSTTWGINGYVLIARNSDSICGILTSPNYPNIINEVAPFPTVSPTRSPEQVSTYSSFLEVNGHLLSGMGSNAQRVALVSASITGLAVGGVAIPSVTCKAKYWTQSNTQSVWFVGAVHDNTAYLVAVILFVSGSNTYIAYPNNADSIIYSIPYSLPTLSCDSISELGNSAKVLKGCLGSHHSWCPGLTFASSDSGTGIAVKNVKYYKIITPTQAPVVSPTAAPTTSPAPTALPTQSPTTGKVSKLYVSQTLNNVTTFGSALEKYVFVNTVNEVLSDYADAILDVTILARGPRRSLVNTVDTIVEYHVSFMTGVLQMSTNDAANTLGAVIDASVQSNNFTTILQTQARGFSVSSLYYASSDSTYSRLVTVNHMSTLIAAELRTNIIIGVSVFVTGLIVSIVICCFRSRITSLFSVSPQQTAPSHNGGVQMVEA